MNTISKHLAVFSVLFIGIHTTLASLVVLDTSTTNSISAVYQKTAASASSTLYLSTDGISDTAGGLEINLAAYAEHPKTYTASIELGTDFAFVSEGDEINLSTAFSSAPTNLVSLLETSGTAVSDAYDGYIAFRMDAGDGDYYYGAAEISATVTRSTNDKTSSAEFILKRMVYNDTANEGLIAGATVEVIPEPAAATLVIGAGVSLLAIRRFFDA